MDTLGQEAIVRALRRLTIAVWALTAVLAVFVGMYLLAYIPYFSVMADSSSERQPSTGPSGASKLTERFEKFYELPPEKQIEAASVIALAKYQKDGDRMKCVISEILKKAPETKFYYKVGDEYGQCSHYMKPGEDRGDGQIMFFVGNPAQFRFSASFRGDRLTGLGDMPVDVLRKQIKEGK
jgi:hypothetical protein